jgi:hypothetical protein
MDRTPRVNNSALIVWREQRDYFPARHLARVTEKRKIKRSDPSKTGPRAGVAPDEPDAH